MRIVVFLFFLLQSLVFTYENPRFEAMKEHIHYNKSGPNTIGYLYIGDHSTAISQGTWIYVKNALEVFKKTKPAFILLELDTPGGELFAAQKIASALKEMDTQYGIPTVAFINNWAISAGALLAYSSRYIAITKDASMGAAEPVTSSGEKTSEKVHSAIRADFANAAAFFDRNPLLAEAMVDADIILVMRNGKVVQLTKEEEIQKSDQLIIGKGKLLTLNAEKMMELKVADLYLPPEKVVPITEAEKNQQHWPASKMLLFKAPFFNEIRDATIVSYQMDWKSHFFAMLTSPIVTSLLFLVLMICFYMEMSTPGFGVPGAVGLLALILILLSSFASEAMGFLELILLIGGVGLILVEIFLVPTFGLVGFIGIAMAALGLLGMLLPGIREFHFDFATQTFNAAGLYILERILWLSLAIIVGFIVIAISSRYLMPKIAKISPLVHREEQDKEKGYVAGVPLEKLPAVGCRGVAYTTLRPAGKVEINGEIFDAVSSGKFIEKGATIVIYKIEGSKLIIDEVNA